MAACNTLPVTASNTFSVLEALQACCTSTEQIVCTSTQRFAQDFLMLGSLAGQINSPGHWEFLDDSLPSPYGWKTKRNTISSLKSTPGFKCFFGFKPRNVGHTCCLVNSTVKSNGYAKDLGSQQKTAN